VGAWDLERKERKEGKTGENHDINYAANYAQMDPLVSTQRELSIKYDVL